MTATPYREVRATVLEDALAHPYLKGIRTSSHYTPDRIVDRIDVTLRDDTNAIAEWDAVLARDGGGIWRITWHPYAPSWEPVRKTTGIDAISSWRDFLLACDVVMRRGGESR